MAEPLQAQLQQQLTNAVDRALTGCPREDFCSAFAVAPEHRPLLEAAASQAYEQLRSSTLVRTRPAARVAAPRVRPLDRPPRPALSQAEFELICREAGADVSLAKLDKMLREQPVLPDGSRCVKASNDEFAASIQRASLPAKQQHRQRLRDALKKAQHENGALEREYVERATKLREASAKVNATTEKFMQARASLPPPHPIPDSSPVPALTPLCHVTDGGVVRAVARGVRPVSATERKRRPSSTR